MMKKLTICGRLSRYSHCLALFRLNGGAATAHHLVSSIPRSFSSSAGEQHNSNQRLERLLNRLPSIDPGVLRLRVPELLLAVAEDGSDSTGELVSQTINELTKLDKSVLSARIYALVSRLFISFYLSLFLVGLSLRCGVAQAIESLLKSSEGKALGMAVELLQNMLNNNQILRSNDKDEIVQIHSAFAQVMHSLLRRFDSGDDIVRNAALNHLIQKADDLHDKMFALFRDKSIPLGPNVTSLNAKIALMGAKNEPDHAMTILKTMVEAQDKDHSTAVAPNTVSYNNVVHAYAKSGRPQGAQDVVRLMIGRYKQGLSDVKPDIVTFNSLLFAYSSSGRDDAGRSAERILDWMEKLSEDEGINVEPDVYSYTTVIDAYAKSSKPERAESVLHRLLQRRNEGYDVEPTVNTFTAVLGAFARAKGKDSPVRAASVVKLMEDLHLAGVDVAPTTVTYNALIHVWNKRRNHPDAPAQVLGILQAMKEKPTHAQPNTRTYNTVLSTLSSSKNDHLLTAEALMEEMRSLRDPNVKPNSITYNCFLNILANTKSIHAISRAYEIFDLMKENRASGKAEAAPISETYNTMMKLESKSPHGGGARAAEKLLEELESLQNFGDVYLKPTASSYSTCINAWSRDGKSSPEERLWRANILMDKMMAAYEAGNEGALPNTIVFNSLLSVYKSVAFQGISLDHQDRVVHEILTLLHNMRRSRNYPPDQTTYVTIIQTFGMLPRQDEQLKTKLLFVFSLCREDELVGEFVVNAMKRVLPPLDLSQGNR
jgi:pentatricopeptide repeat protein